MQNETKLSLLHTKIDELWEKYSDNDQILNKLIYQVTNTLPNHLSTSNTQLLEKQNKKVKFNEIMREFTDDFLSEYNYTFIPSTNLFIKYDDVNYQVINEDDIQHMIYNKLARNNELSDSKDKVKTFILKTIKDRLITNTIPESITIQNTLSIFYPLIFSSKREAQYFLTIIGDNILKKNLSLVHIIDNAAKDLINILGQLFNQFMGNLNALNTIKYKYYDQKYEYTRLLKLIPNFNLHDIWKQNLPNQFLNIIAVACHYSIRYSSSDNFVESKITDPNVKNYIFFLKNNTYKTILNEFTSEYLIQTPDNNLKVKDMLYLWKLYLENKRCPSIMFTNTFKNNIQELIEYDESNELYKNITSKHLPSISKFIDFWNESIENTSNKDHELDIDEMHTLYKRYCESKNQHAVINEDQILSIIEHFFPNITIIENKYITNITTKLWDKNGEIINFVNHYNSTEDSTKTISINRLYKLYCKYQYNKRLICNKIYFTKFIKTISESFPCLGIK